MIGIFFRVSSSIILLGTKKLISFVFRSIRTTRILNKFTRRSISRRSNDASVWPANRRARHLCGSRYQLVVSTTVRSTVDEQAETARQTIDRDGAFSCPFSCTKNKVFFAAETKNIIWYNRQEASPVFSILVIHQSPHTHNTRERETDILCVCVCLYRKISVYLYYLLAI